MFNLLILLVIGGVLFGLGLKIGIRIGKRTKDIENIKNEIKELKTWKLK